MFDNHFAAHMKMFRSLAVIVVAAAIFNLTSCGSDPAPEKSPQDQQLEKLSKTWKMTSVTQDGNAPQDPYTGFQLGITSTAGQTTFSYTTTGRPTGTFSPWGPSGTFTFGSDFATTLTRDDGTTITYAVSATQLQMTFTYSGAGYQTRAGVFTGNWVFTFGL